MGVLRPFEGDTVSIKKAGDVIPEIVKVIFDRRDGTQKKFSMIKNCPMCGSSLVKKEGESAYYCLNEECDSRKQEKLIHFTSRHAMNITGFGEAIIEDFYNMNYIRGIDDFYNLKKYKDELKTLEGFGEKSIENLLTSIENSKKNSLESVSFWSFSTYRRYNTRANNSI